MKKIITKLDDWLAPKLEKFLNKSEDVENIKGFKNKFSSVQKYLKNK